MKRPKIYFLIGVILAAVLFGAYGIARLSHKTPLQPVVPGVLYRSAQLDAKTLSHLARNHIKIVVNLREGDENDEPQIYELEKKNCQAQGIELVHIPISALLPSDAQVVQFLQIVQSNRGAVLVHCKQGRARTGMMVAAYRIIIQGWPADKAYQEMCDFKGVPRPEEYQQKHGLIKRFEDQRAQFLEMIRTGATTMPASLPATTPSTSQP